MNVPEDRKYAQSHEWVLVHQDVGTVGITDHAQEELTDVVFIELPKVGSQIGVQNPVAVVESVKAASDIYSPVSGEILETNSALESDPGLINTDPYGKGWIYKIRLTSPSELEKLLSASDYGAQLNR